MARRYSEKEHAAIWALRCQQGKVAKPIEIRRALATDGAGLGYPLEVPKRTMQDILKRLETRHGAPAAAVDAGTEGETMDAVRREGIGAIRQRVRELTAKQSAGKELNQSEIRTLDAAVRAADGFERRASGLGINGKKSRAARDGREAKDSATSTLVRDLAKKMRAADNGSESATTATHK